MKSNHGVLALMMVLAIGGCSTTDPELAPDDDEGKTREGQFVVPVVGGLQLTMAMAGTTPEGWRSYESQPQDLGEPCPTVGPLPDVAPSDRVGFEVADREPSGPVTQELESLQASATLVTGASQQPMDDYVASLTRCDGTSSEGSRWKADVEDVDGVAVTTVVESSEQSGAPTRIRTTTIELVDRFVVECSAEGTNGDDTGDAAWDCHERARDAVRILAEGLPASGTVASAGVVAGRVERVESHGLPRLPVPMTTPCAGLGPAPTPQDSISATAGVPTPTGAPVTVVVRPLASERAAKSELQDYVDLAARCRTGDVEIPPTDRTPPVVVSRTGAATAPSGFDGVGFSSTVTITGGVAIGAIQTDVLTVGPHLVFVMGLGADADAASAHADEAVAQVLEP